MHGYHQVSLDTWRLSIDVKGLIGGCIFALQGFAISLKGLMRGGFRLGSCGF